MSALFCLANLVHNIWCFQALRGLALTAPILIIDQGHSQLTSHASQRVTESELTYRIDFKLSHSFWLLSVNLQESMNPTQVPLTIWTAAADSLSQDGLLNPAPRRTEPLTSSEEICEFARMSVHTNMVLLVRVSFYRLLASRTNACALSF